MKSATQSSALAGKLPLGDFLAQNPFGNPHTLGFFYREKMRAIHRIAPDERFQRILDVGGGQGGLAHMLYPGARVTNIDMNSEYGGSPVNRGEHVDFVCGDATRLPFPTGHFDAVVMFDLLEHVPDDSAAAREGLRVLRPGGVLMASSPNSNWRFPYYAPLRPLVPSEEEMFREWGHVRRGYADEELDALIGLAPAARASFINPVTVIGHDLSFSTLPKPLKRGIVAALSPLTWLGYALHGNGTRGTETASAWRKP